MQSPVNYYSKARQFLTEDLWRVDKEPQAPLKRMLWRSMKLLFVLVREFSNGQLNLRAMSLVYTTLLSMVPLIAVSFSVLKAFDVHNQIEPLLYNLVEPLGDKGGEIVTTILTFVENMKVGVLGSVGLAFLLYTVISLIQKIENAFNYVWQAKSERSLSRRFSDYLSVIMVGPVLVFSAMGVTASLMNSDLVQHVRDIEPFGTLLILVTSLVPFILVVLAFSFVYMFVPNTQVKFTSAVVGAVVGGGLWQFTGMAFAQFAASSTKYAAIYSSFAILVLFMIWIYLSWLILLIGAQVAYYHQNPHQVRLSNQRLPLNGRFREQMALLVLYWITRHFVHDRKPLALEELSNLTRLSGERVGEILQQLQDRNLIAESSSEPPEFLLLHDPASLSVAELLVLLRESGEEQALIESQTHSVTAVDRLLSTVELSIEERLAGLSLRDLVLEDEQPDEASTNYT
ncbi:MAG: YihY/virulence factor BrkB family protein [Porticoccaceae bacterium]